MSYRKVIPIEFNHCDPAGIVFYPRYFEMTNSVVENFFADVLDHPFAKVHAEPGNGVPTVAIDCRFIAPTRLGERLDFDLSVTSIGTSSLGLRLQASCAGKERLEAKITLVWVIAGRAQPWPEAIRTVLTSQHSGEGNQ